MQGKDFLTSLGTADHLKTLYNVAKEQGLEAALKHDLRLTMLRSAVFPTRANNALFVLLIGQGASGMIGPIAERVAEIYASKPIEVHVEGAFRGAVGGSMLEAYKLGRKMKDSLEATPSPTPQVYKK